MMSFIGDIVVLVLGHAPRVFVRSRWWTSEWRFPCVEEGHCK